MIDRATGKHVGLVEKRTVREPVMTCDRGLNYCIGHTQRTVWSAFSEFDSIARQSTMSFAAECLHSKWQQHMGLAA